MIEVSGLQKEYGGFLAVRDNTFTVESGEIFGIVGPNGAGKTTTLKTVAGLIEPTAGEITVAGGSPEDPDTRAKLGFLPEESPVYEDMTARSYLAFFADLYDVPSDVAAERIESTLDDLELDHRDRRLGDVSKGMKRKVAIARSLVNDPDVLIYDEPASGLDPLTTNYVLQFVRELADRGKTVLFSAHNLYHVESVCDRVSIMNEGESVARGTMADIRAAYGETSYHVFTTVPVEGAEPVGDASGARSRATGDAAPGGEGVSPPGPGSTADGVSAGDTDPAGDGASAAGHDDEPKETRYRVTVESMDAVERIREACTAAGGRVADIRTRESTLEEIFLDVAGQPMPGSRRVGDERFVDSSDDTTGAGDGATAADDESRSGESERASVSSDGSEGGTR